MLSTCNKTCLWSRIVWNCKKANFSSTHVGVQTNVSKDSTHSSESKSKKVKKSTKKPTTRKLLVDDISTKILGDRKRCTKLQSLQEEFFVVSTINVLLSQGMVQHAEPLLNEYRREGHQFDVDVFNNIILGWAEQDYDIKAILLYKTMKAQGIRPNYRTYGALLYLYARSGSISEAVKLIEQIKEEGFNAHQLLYNSALSAQQTEKLKELLSKLNLQQIIPSIEKVSFPRLSQSLYDSPDTTKTVCHSSREVVQMDSLQQMVESQIEIEERTYEVIPSITNKINEKPNKFAAMFSSLTNEWETALKTAIENELKDYTDCLKTMEEENWYSHSSLPKHYPFLATLSSDVWTAIAMEEIVNRTLYNSDGQPLSYLCHCVLGPAWRKYIILQKKKRGITGKVKSFCVDYTRYVMGSNKVPAEMNGRLFWEKMQRQDFENGSISYDNRCWPYTVGVYVGSVLVDIVLESLKIPSVLKSIEDLTDDSLEKVPAFVHSYSNNLKGKRVGTLSAHPSLYKLIKKLNRRDNSPSFRMPALELPMLVPPHPWTSVTEGGYLVLPGTVVRCYEDTYQHQLLLESSNTMDPILDSLNYVSSQPWRVNGKILDLVIGLFNKGGDTELDIPTTNLPEIPKLPPKDEEVDEQSRRTIIRQRKAVKKIHKEAFALRMDMLYKLSVADHYRHRMFWFPHNMDFRSRVYPIPPHISHISNDIGRSLIQFGIGYPLGDKGLNWLKIHLATLHGAKSKNSFDERLKFIEENLPKIFDSADYPFEGEKWWQGADEPWQALACCIELASAIRSPDPSQFISHIPVHQDGSCNGLQHYAAMGRDRYGAEQVNLVPYDKPADLYSGVATLVDKLRRKDAENGDELAILLEGKVHRKVVKQTVMTVVYGVTWVGGRQQIEKQLKGSIPDEYLFKASSYLVTLVFSSLSEMFSNAKKIQDWLTSSARMIALAGYPVEWVTPLGMPVVQPYHKRVSKQHLTRLQNVNKVNKTDFTTPPDSAKQRSAMPPNFVHSLDSTHMMLTSLHCQRAGVPFVAVHDSYWTHPCFVDNMNKICREQFVSLHNEPILDDLADFFEKKYGGLKYKDVASKWSIGKPGIKKCSFKDILPSRGEFELECIKESTYFFS